MNPRHVALSVVLAALLTGCPKSGVICTSNETRCGQTCANFQSNPDHCGDCGTVCAAGFVCESAKCVCEAKLGLTACGQACVDTQTSVSDCGSCGNACPQGQVCAQGQCAAGCPAGQQSCGGGCVDVQTDAQNCGGCSDGGGVACAQGQSCRGGVCGSDLYAACQNSGAVYGLDGQSEVVAGDRAMAPPSNPAGLAFHGPGALAVVDGTANQLYTFDLAQGLGAMPDTFDVGVGPNAVAIDGDTAAVTNGQANSLDVLTAAGPGWSRRCPGSATCQASVQFGANTSPEYAAFSDDSIYVTLAGNTFVSGPTGNQLARVSRADLSVQLTDLSGLDLQSDGGTQPRPAGVAVQGNTAYVALQNLAGYTAGAPGLVEVLDLPADGGAATLHGQPVALGEGCVNAGALLLSGSTLYVACGPTYDPTTFAVATPGALGALDLSQDPPAPLFAPVPFTCPPGSTDCLPGGATRMALADGKLFIGDSSNGRVFVADPATGALSRGPDDALSVCLAPDGGFDYISDLVARP